MRVAHRVEGYVGLDVLCELDCGFWRVSFAAAREKQGPIEGGLRGGSRVVTLRQLDAPVSPASPTNAMSVWSLSLRVFSSLALMMVGPRVAAREEAMMV